MRNSVHGLPWDRKCIFWGSGGGGGDVQIKADSCQRQIGHLLDDSSSWMPELQLKKQHFSLPRLVSLLGLR